MKSAGFKDFLNGSVQPAPPKPKPVKTSIMFICKASNEMVLETHNFDRWLGETEKRDFFHSNVNKYMGTKLLFNYQTFINGDLVYKSSERDL